eukprot:scaffold68946_cov24-Cyclotella_meneghiniana.AAC.1
MIVWSCESYYTTGCYWVWGDGDGRILLDRVVTFEVENDAWNSVSTESVVTLGRWMGDGMASISIVAEERRGVERRAEKERRKIIFSGKDRMILGNSQRIPYFYEKH